MNKNFMKQKIWMKANKPDIDLPFLQQEHVGHFVSQMTLSHHRFFLDNDIADPSEYRDLIQTLITAQENDCIELIISNGGGQLESCVNIISAIRESDATVRAVVTGSCHSAASFITLSCHEVAVLDFATMLVHNASFGTFGKASEITTQVRHMDKYLDSIIHEIYIGFLKEEEIKQVLAGVDFWFDAEQIRERLKIRQEFFAKEEKKQIKELKKQQKAIEKQINEKSQEIVDKVVDKVKTD